MHTAVAPHGSSRAPAAPRRAASPAGRVPCPARSTRGSPDPVGAEALPSDGHYAPECVEGVFSELRLYGVLRSSHRLGPTHRERTEAATLRPSWYAVSVWCSPQSHTEAATLLTLRYGVVRATHCGRLADVTPGDRGTITGAARLSVFCRALPDGCPCGAPPVLLSYVAPRPGGTVLALAARAPGTS